jgi:phosphoglycolate phosphatase-like HAD superfamily hydrolase
MGPIELVVFDLAGTTVQDDGAVLNCLMEATSRHGLPGSREELNALMG